MIASAIARIDALTPLNHTVLYPLWATTKADLVLCLTALEKCRWLMDDARQYLESNNAYSA